MLISVTVPVIDWSYEFYLFTSSQASDLYRRQDPALMHVDPTDNSIFYMSGRYQGKGSVMKFQKRTGRMIWWAQLNNVTSIRSIATVPKQSIFYGCGDNFDNEGLSNVADLAVDAIYTASIFKMDSDGSVKWLYKIGGTNPVAGKKNQDRCYGVTVD